MNRNMDADLRIYEDESGRRQFDFDGEEFPFYTDGEVTVQRIITPPFWPDSTECGDLGYVVMVPVRVFGKVTMEGKPPSVRWLENKLIEHEHEAVAPD